MKVLTVVKLDPIKYGNFERFCVHFTRYLQEYGHEHYVIFKSKPSQFVGKQLEDNGASVLVKDYKRLGLFDSIALFKCSKSIGADIIHLHFYKPLSWFSLLAFFMYAKCFATYHISGPVDDPPPLKRFIKLLYGWIFSVGLEKVFCVSEYNRKKFNTDYEVCREKAVVAYNGISLNDFPALEFERRSTADNIFKCICVAALIPQKGIQIALEAVSLLAKEGVEIILDIAGSGKYRTSLELMTKELGIKDRVTFLGQRDDIPSLLKGYQVALVPSVWCEAFGYTIIEAMAAGATVVASRTGGIPEIIEDGVTGVLVEPGNSEALKEGIKILVENKNKMEQIRLKARECVERRFNMDRLLKHHLSEYNNSLGNI